MTTAVRLGNARRLSSAMRRGGLGLGTAAIVLMTLCWVASASAASRALVGGRVLVDGRMVDQTVLIDDGRISALVPAGETTEAMLEDRDAIRVDGTFVVPGLVDAHLHLTGYGRSLEEVDLVGSSSWAEVVRRAVERADELPPGAWLLGRGWDQNRWNASKTPDRADFDAALPDRPVLLRRVDGHAAVANGLALRRAGIDRETADPAGGRIVRRSDGVVGGALVDTAVELVRAVIPEPSEADVERWTLGSATALAELGITGVHDAGTTAVELAVLTRLAAQDRLPIRVWALIDGDDPELVDEVLQRPPAFGSSVLRVGGVKLYADGALGSRGALLGSDYADEPGHRGLEVTPAKELTAVARRVSAAGYQLAIHAIGDEAVHRVLDLYQRLGPARCRQLRHRVEHSQIVRPEDLSRFVRLGAVASVQPTHCTSDMPWAPRRLGESRVPWAYRWRSLLDSGAALAGGTDAPVESPDPRLGLYAAITRKAVTGGQSVGWNTAESLSPTEALALFTSGAAWAGHAEAFSGEIRVGADADLTVLSGNPLVGPPERLLHLEIVSTIVAGEPRGGGGLDRKEEASG